MYGKCEKRLQKDDLMRERRFKQRQNTCNGLPKPKCDRNWNCEFEDPYCIGNTDEETEIKQQDIFRRRDEDAIRRRHEEERLQQERQKRCNKKPVCDQDWNCNYQHPHCLGNTTEEYIKKRNAKKGR